jgi:hypothetical protein
MSRTTRIRLIAALGSAMALTVGLAAYDASARDGVPARGMLFSPSAVAQMPADKQARLELQAQLRHLTGPATPAQIADKQAWVKAHTHRAGRRTANAAMPELAQGLFQDHQAPFPGGAYTIVNHWAGTSVEPHVLTQVFAGAQGASPAQGVVVVVRVSVPDLHVLSNQEYAAGAHGAVHITAVSAAVLTVVADDGTRMTFNAATGRLR